MSAENVEHMCAYRRVAFVEILEDRTLDGGRRAVPRIEQWIGYPDDVHVGDIWDNGAFKMKALHIYEVASL